MTSYSDFSYPYLLSICDGHVVGSTGNNDIHYYAVILPTPSTIYIYDVYLDFVSLYFPGQSFVGIVLSIQSTAGVGSVGQYLVSNQSNGTTNAIGNGDTMNSFLHTVVAADIRGDFAQSRVPQYLGFLNNVPNSVLSFNCSFNFMTPAGGKVYCSPSVNAIITAKIRFVPKLAYGAPLPVTVTNFPSSQNVVVTNTPLSVAVSSFPSLVNVNIDSVNGETLEWNAVPTYLSDNNITE